VWFAAPPKVGVPLCPANPRSPPEPEGNSRTLSGSLLALILFLATHQRPMRDKRRGGATVRAKKVQGKSRVHEVPIRCIGASLNDHTSAPTRARATTVRDSSSEGFFLFNNASAQRYQRVQTINVDENKKKAPIAPPRDLRKKCQLLLQDHANYVT